MYEVFFGLNQRPFVAPPQVERYFPSAAAEAALQTLARGIDRCEGVGLLVGPSGSGKTLLLHMLAERFRERFAVALLTNTHLTTRRELLQAMLFELHLPYRDLEEGELRLSLIDHLSRPSFSPEGMLLLLDEAHKLPLRLLEEVRMITNLVRQGQPRVRLVLAGGASLEERLASPKLESFAQRIRARCYLESLSESETAEYVRAQIRRLGGDPAQIFTDDALHKVYQATDGIPRLVNQVCDHALVLAFAGGRKQIDGAGLEAAWADLQQLPTPWNEESRPQPSAPQTTVPPPAAVGQGRDTSFIEFGTLEDSELEDREQAAIRADIEPSLAPTVAEDAAAPETEEFEPATSVKPEVELVFDPHANPFAESFAEEEVVFDRYAAANPGASAKKAVYSAEGVRLSAMLEPFLQPAKPKLTIAEEAEDSEEVDLEAIEEAEHRARLGEESSDSEMAGGQATLLDPVTDPVMPEVKRAIPLSQLAAAQVHAVDAPREAPRAESRPQATPRKPSEQHEVIIIEEDVESTQWSTHRPPLARRQEYRQLFVKLRGDK